MVENVSNVQRKARQRRLLRWKWGATCRPQWCGDRYSRLVIGVITSLSIFAISHTVEAEAPISNEKVDRILILKVQHRLYLMSGERVLKSYPVALGRISHGAKRVRGDGKTPEGLYRIDGRNAHSLYHLSLHLSYPNDLDIKRARAAGASPGGGIAIHGMPNRYGPFDPVAFYTDWTDGCIAVGNRAIEEIWNRVNYGTPVEIRP